MNRVLVTGASGFIGDRLCRLLLNNGYIVRAIYRTSAVQNNKYEQLIVGDINQYTQWGEALRDVDYVIHLAARVHVMNETTENPLAKFREVNLFGTENLARQAADQGVKRFIYLSSIKVNGEKTENNPFTANDMPSPTDAYAKSKVEAENELHVISRERNLDIVIIRPPLVYGPGVRGNYLRLLNLVNKGIPLPLANIHNKRSMVSLDNICDLLINCLKNQNAAGKTFLVSDGIDWSTPDLIRKLAYYMGVPAYLFPIPQFLLDLAGQLTGKKGVIDRLCDSLVVDINDTRNHLGWSPPQTIEEGVRQTVEWYLHNKKADQVKGIH